MDNTKRKTRSESRKNIAQVPSKKKTVKPKKKSKIKYKNIVIFLLILIVLSFGVMYLYKKPIKNIVIIGNTFLTDQEIIDAANLRDYPSSIQNSSNSIEDKLLKHTYIKNAHVKKSNFMSKVILEIEENKPAFFYQPANKTVLEDGSTVEDKFSVPTVINLMPDVVYEKFLSKMNMVPEEVLMKMSEVRYTPNEVDTERFFIAMSDGNYVYINLYRFEAINDYIEYVEALNNKKGIFHLDGGNHFETLEEN